MHYARQNGVTREVIFCSEQETPLNSHFVRTNVCNKGVSMSISIIYPSLAN